MLHSIKIRSLIVFTTLFYLSAAFTGIYAQDTEYDLKEERLNGPRLGVTYSPDIKSNREWNETIREKGMDNIISQFGWQFEWLVSPDISSPAFVTEIIPFLGGVEYSTVIPSGSCIFGIRMPNGLEFGMGPNVMFTFAKGDPVNTALIAAVGKSLEFNGVNIPLNLAVLKDKGGARVSFVFGYAIRS